jgi:NADH dehydrogenase [ubiquinone] 1 alpha subcomplex assembly factor 5
MAKDIFNRSNKRLQRNRAASTIGSHNFLLQEAELLLQETLDQLITESFPTVLNLGAATEGVVDTVKNIRGAEQIIHADMAESMLYNIDTPLKLCADEEKLPFAPESFNLVTSMLSLHWVNDIASTIGNIKFLLKDRGLFIAIIIGGNSLAELRHSILQAEMDTGTSPRVSPFVHLKDAGALLQHTGYHIPVSNSETFTVMYDSPHDLMRELKAMGETNALLQRHPYFTSRSKMQKIVDKYVELFADDNGHIPATFELITLTGWKS